MRACWREGALAETKKRAVQVRDRLVAAREMRESINEKREQYRPVATRGAVLYFAMGDLSLVNVMYQTSLDHFQTVFIRYRDRYATGPSMCLLRHFRGLLTFLFDGFEAENSHPFLCEGNIQ